jgi:hypothetical protein
MGKPTVTIKRAPAPKHTLGSIAPGTVFRLSAGSRRFLRLNESSFACMSTGRTEKIALSALPVFPEGTPETPEQAPIESVTLTLSADQAAVVYALVNQITHKRLSDSAEMAKLDVADALWDAGFRTCAATSVHPVPSMKGKRP